MRSIDCAWTDQSGNIRIRLTGGSCGNFGCGSGEVISFSTTSVIYKKGTSIMKYEIKGNSESHSAVGRTY